MSRICLCLTSSTVEGALTQIRELREHIDLVELRLDLLDPAEREAAADLPSRSGLPVILTIRLPDDGGRWGARGETPEERERLFLRLLSADRWAYVDLEHDRPLESVATAARRSGTEVIRSIHDFSGTLLERPVASLAALVRRISDAGIPKLSALCGGNRQLLNLARTATALAPSLSRVLTGMGEYGVPAEILAGRLGSLWSCSSISDTVPGFGGCDSAEQQAPAAQGQLDPRDLDVLYRCRSIGPDTPLYAVIGNPVAHSRSPEIHNGWLRRAGLAGTYLPMRCDNLPALLELCDLWGISGLSVTVPHKEQALSLSEYADPVSRKIGAVNTLIRGGDGWRGRNTDAAGFLCPLLRALDLDDPSRLRGMKALVIGAGGAARAVVHALADAGVRMVILNRNAERAQRLAAGTGALPGPLDESSGNLVRDGVDFAVQTTTVGMKSDPDADPVPWWNFEGCRLVYDLIYAPPETALLTRARAAGLRTLNGSAMLVEQARLQFRMFTGQDAPEDD